MSAIISVPPCSRSKDLVRMAFRGQALARIRGQMSGVGSSVGHSILRGDAQDAAKLMEFFASNVEEYDQAIAAAVLQNKSLMDMSVREPVIRMWWMRGGDPMRDRVERALSWYDTYGDILPDGYVPED